jgi:RimJ/RimL family protein N-acetyltransferase
MTPLRFPDPPLADGPVRLRGWTAADLPGVESAVRDPAIKRFNGLPDPFDAGGWLARMPAERAEGTALRMLIADAASDEMLGAIALHRLRLAEGAGELGYWLSAHARGRGVATVAVRLLTCWAARDLALRRFEAIADVANVASARLLQRCGFVREREIVEGTRRAVRYALISSTGDLVGRC